MVVGKLLFPRIRQPTFTDELSASFTLRWPLPTRPPSRLTSFTKSDKYK